MFIVRIVKTELVMWLEQETARKYTEFWCGETYWKIPICKTGEHH